MTIDVFQVDLHEPCPGASLCLRVKKGRMLDLQGQGRDCGDGGDKVDVCLLALSCWASVLGHAGE